MKIVIIILGIYILANLCFNMYQAYTLDMNDYYSEWYYYVYCLCLLPFFISIVLYFMYYCQKDHPSARARIPIAILCALIGSLAIFIWILIYVFGIYESDDHIMVGSGHAAEEGEEETNYVAQDKGEYILEFGIFHLLNAFLYLLFIFIARDWVKRNEKYEKST